MLQHTSLVLLLASIWTTRHPVQGADLVQGRCLTRFLHGGYTRAWEASKAPPALDHGLLGMEETCEVIRLSGSYCLPKEV